MNEIKASFAMILFLLAKLARFNAFAGVVFGVFYGVLANLLDREFLGLGSTQIEFLGVACSIVFFALSTGFTISGNYFLSDVNAVDHRT